MKPKHQPTLPAPVSQSGGKIPTNTVARRRFALEFNGILFIAVCALWPSPARAECKHWDVGGELELREKMGTSLELNLRPSEYGDGQSANIIGTGKLTDRDDPGGLPCTVSGNITEHAVAMKVIMKNSTTRPVIMRYMGTVDRDGSMSGHRWVEGPQSDIKVQWVCTRALKCAEANSPSSKPTTGDASSNSSARAGISVSQSNGSGTLTWNAGGGHPNAEVWVRVNDHDEKLLFTGPTGTQTVTVKAGKKYVYMLRDGGKQLDSATVKGGGKSGQKGHHDDD